jgi:membrane dipeptidase
MKETTNADMRRRLISKESALEVAAAGGVVGVWWRLSGSVKEYVAGVRSMVDAIGVDHVGIGTDTYLIEPNGRPGTDRTWPDLNGRFFYAVAGEMLKQGFAPNEIGKIGGGNFCRVFGKVTAGHA